MSIHFERTVFIAEQVCSKRSRKQGKWTMGRSNTGRKQSKISTAIILITLLLLVVVVLVKSIQLREKRAELQVQAAEITAQIEDAQNEHKKLEEKEDYMKTKKYVEDVARNQLGLVYPCLLYTSPSPRDGATSRMPSSA